MSSLTIAVSCAMLLVPTFCMTCACDRRGKKSNMTGSLYEAMDMLSADIEGQKEEALQMLQMRAEQLTGSGIVSSSSNVGSDERSGQASETEILERDDRWLDSVLAETEDVGNKATQASGTGVQELFQGVDAVPSLTRDGDLETGVAYFPRRHDSMDVDGRQDVKALSRLGSVTQEQPRMQILESTAPQGGAAASAFGTPPEQSNAAVDALVDTRVKQPSSIGKPGSDPQTVESVRSRGSTSIAYLSEIYTWIADGFRQQPRPQPRKPTLDVQSTSQLQVNVVPSNEQISTATVATEHVKDNSTARPLSELYMEAWNELSTDLFQQQPIPQPQRFTLDTKSTSKLQVDPVLNEHVSTATVATEHVSGNSAMRPLWELCKARISFSGCMEAWNELYANLFHPWTERQLQPSSEENSDRQLYSFETRLP